MPGNRRTVAPWLQNSEVRWLASNLTLKYFSLLWELCRGEKCVFVGRIGRGNRRCDRHHHFAAFACAARTAAQRFLVAAMIRARPSALRRRLGFWLFAS